MEDTFSPEVMMTWEWMKVTGKAEMKKKKKEEKGWKVRNTQTSKQLATAGVQVCLWLIFVQWRGIFWKLTPIHVQPFTQPIDPRVDIPTMDKEIYFLFFASSVLEHIVTESNRFRELHKFLHFTNSSTLAPPGTPGYDKLANHFNDWGTVCSSVWSWLRGQHWWARDTF